MFTKGKFAINRQIQKCAADWQPQELHRTLHRICTVLHMLQEQQQKFCPFLDYMEWIWAQIITSGKKCPLTYGHFTVRTPKSSQAISQQVKLVPLMQRESKSWQFLCGRGLFLLAQAVNDCLKHKVLERQAGNDNKSRNQPNMSQLHWNSIFW